MGAKRRNAALRHRDFVRLFAAQCASVPGTYAAHVGLAVYAWEATGSATWVAAVTFGRFLPALLASPYAGVLAEHVERVRLLVVSDLLMALWQALIVVVVLADGPVLLVVVLAAVNSVTGSAYRPALAALTPLLVGERDLVSAGAMTAALRSIVLVIGSAVGGLVAVMASPAWVVVANGLSFLVSAVLVASIRSAPALRRVDRVSAEVQAELGPRVAVLGSTGLLAEAAPAALQRLAAGANEVGLAPGEVLMTAGEPADALHVLLEGRLSVHGPAGEVLPAVRDGVVGEIGLLAGVPRTATVTAAEPSRLLRVEGREFVDSSSVTPAAPTLLAGATDRLARTHPAHTGIPGSRGGRRPGPGHR
jgi:MFS family permease